MPESQASRIKKSAHQMYDRMEDAELVSADIAQLYQRAYAEVTSTMARFFKKHATDTGMTEKEAMRILGKMKDPSDINALRKELRRVGTPQAKEVLAMLDNPAFSSRIKLMQDIQKKVDDINQQLYGQNLSKQTTWYKNLAKDTYYHTVFDVQKEVGFQFSFAHLDSKMINRALTSDWYGKSYVGSLMDSIDGLTQEVKEQLILGMITGKSEKRMAEEIEYRYQVGAYESRRIVRTESCYVSNEMQFASYEECGADKYMYVATLDSKTDEECGALDRKIFDVKDKTPGLNCPPMHPFCRCTTKIYIDQDARDDMKRRARNPVTGKNELVPANMSYNEWAKQNGITPKKSTPTKTQKKASNTIGANTDTPTLKTKDEPKPTVKKQEQKPVSIEEAKKQINGWTQDAVQNGAMSENIQQAFVDKLAQHEDVRQVAVKYGAPKGGYRKDSEGDTTSYYSPNDGSITLKTRKDNPLFPGYDLPEAEIARINSTAAVHEQFHMYDDVFDTSGLSFKERDAMNERLDELGITAPIDFWTKHRPSQSDEFLAAIRKDRDRLLDYAERNHTEGTDPYDAIVFIGTKEFGWRTEGIGDFLDGCGFKKTEGHGDAYYDRQYTTYKKKGLSDEDLDEVYKKVGVTTKSAKQEMRIYETASEAWANIAADYTSGSEKRLMKYMPESYKVFRKIIGGA